jgi:hypothetical protein
MTTIPHFLAPFVIRLHAHRTEERGFFFPQDAEPVPTSTRKPVPLQRNASVTALMLRVFEPALRAIETGSKSRDRERVRDTAGFPDRGFDVSLDRVPEILVCDGALDQMVELTARERKLLRGGDPGVRGRRKGSEELHQALFVECRHRGHRSPDGSEGSDLPSS